MSPEAWTSFSAIGLGIIAVLGQQISAKREANEAKIQARKAALNSQKAQENTAGISNGFAGRMDRKLDAIIAEQDSQGNALRTHLEWHLNSERKREQ